MCIILVTRWSGFHLGLFLLVFVCWKICVLVPHQIDLCHLGFTCHLLDVSDTVTFELSIFLASCLILLAGNLPRSILLSFMVLDTDSSSLRKNQKYLCEESWLWLSLVDTWSEQPGSGQCYTIHPPTCFLAGSLLEDQIGPTLHLNGACRILQTFLQIVSRVTSSVDRLQETYWSMPKSPLQVITFLHFLLSESITSSHSRIFSHFKYHFRHLWCRPSLTVQSILGPSM